MLQFASTALHLAAFHGHGDCVDILLEAGADTTVTNQVLPAAACEWSECLVLLLLSVSVDTSALCCWCSDALAVTWPHISTAVSHPRQGRRARA